MSTATGVTIRHEYHWPDDPDVPVPALPGFIVSSFSPLLAAVADGCLSEHYAEPSASAVSRQRTALVLVSRGGDRVSADHVRLSVAAGQRLGPLYFFQSVPNSVAGQIAAHWGLGGPVVCISPVGNALQDGIAEAELLMCDGDADEVLLLLVEQGSGSSTRDRAHALLLARGDTP